MPSFTPSHRRGFSFPHLRATNQETNSRIHNLLAYWRACHRPTHHAKRRAAFLNLSVDTVKAYGCNYKKVSSVPLPVLELEPSPLSIQLVYPQGCAPIQIDEAPVVPQDSEDSESSCYSSSSSMSSSSLSSFEGELVNFHTQEETTKVEARQTERPARPILRCIIPVQPPVERSYFSPDSEYSAVCLTSQMESLTTSNTLAAPQATYPTENGLLISGFATASSSSSSSSSPSQPSSNPLTPEAAYPAVVTSIKRKHMEIEHDSDDGDISSCDEIRHVFDKRRKFERKSWVGIVAGGQPIRIQRPSAPLHGTSRHTHVSALRGSSRF